MKHQTQIKANTTTSTPIHDTTTSAPQTLSKELRLLPLAEVMYRTSLSRSLLYSLIQRKRFPPPVKIGGASRWSSNQIDAWLNNLLSQTEAVR